MVPMAPSATSTRRWSWSRNSFDRDWLMGGEMAVMARLMANPGLLIESG